MNTLNAGATTYQPQTAFQATPKPHIAKPQPAATPVIPVAPVTAIAIGTAPPPLQLTATSFTPAIAANPAPPCLI